MKSSPLVRALAEYKVMFEMHSTRLEKVKEAILARAELCESLLNQAQIQYRAVLCTINYLKRCVESYKSIHSTFIISFDQQRVNTESLLQEFETNMDIVRDSPSSLFFQCFAILLH